jgi:hypothetical protein
MLRGATPRMFLFPKYHGSHRGGLYADIAVSFLSLFSVQLDVSSAAVRELKPGDGHYRQNAAVIIVKGRKMFVAADSPELLRAWISALRAVSQNHGSEATEATARDSLPERLHIDGLLECGTELRVSAVGGSLDKFSIAWFRYDGAEDLPSFCDMSRLPEVCGKARGGGESVCRQACARHHYPPVPPSIPSERGIHR